MPPAAGKGRKPGSVNKTTTAVKDALMLAFDSIGGVPALSLWAKDNPEKFYPIWAKLLPQEIKGELELTHATAEERNSRIDAILDAARARRDRSTGNGPA